jgi:hypothetical protein
LLAGIGCFSLGQLSTLSQRDMKKSNIQANFVIF